MKKILILLAVMGILLPGGRRLQAGVPVKGYRISTTQTLPEITGTLTTFSLRDRLDTLTGDYLRTEAEPFAMTGYSYYTLESYPIGFEFPFAGNNMTVFGITGNGFIYLGQKDSLTVKYSMSLNPNDSNIILAMPRLMQWGRTQNLVTAADERTEIGFLSSTVSGENLLLIRFKDLLLSAGSETYRWSYDVVLFQNGNVSIHFQNTEIPESTDPADFTFGLSFGLKGNASPVSISNWNGTTDIDYLQAIPFAQENKGATLTFTYPPACERPTGTELTISLKKQLSHSLTASLTVNGTYDNYIAFLADTDELDEKPIDGKVYVSAYNTDPDSIGNYPVLIYDNTDKEQASISVNNLISQKDYYIYAFPYNDRCIDGPLYSEEPLIQKVSTIQAPPSVSVLETTENSVKLLFDPKPESEILVGIARRDYGTADRIITLKEQDYAEGDTLFYEASTAEVNGNKGPYLIRVCYAGFLSDQTLLLENLEESTPYYLYFWTKTGDKQYTTEYTPVGAYTTGITPLTFDFAEARIPAYQETAFLPAGWSSSEDMNIAFAAGSVKIGGLLDTETLDADKRRSLCANLMVNDGSNFYAGDLITPTFIAGYSSLNIFYRVQLSASSMLGTNLSLLAMTDTLSLWFRTESTPDWVRADLTTSETFPAYEEDNYTTLKSRISVVEGETVQLRIMINGQVIRNQSRRFSLNNVYIEPALPCSYPINICVNDSLTTHRYIAIDWKDENKPAASSILYRYRIQGSEIWSAYMTATRKDGGIAGPLAPHTPYEIDIRSVCHSGDTSLVKIIEASTLYGLPYKQNLTNISRLPEEMKIAAGKLPEEGYATLKTTTSGFLSGISADTDGNTTIGCSLANTSTQPQWLIFPTICLEDITAPSQYSFLYKLYHKSSAGELETYPKDTTVRILVLLSSDGRFSSAEIIDTISGKDLKAEYQKYTIDLSSHIRQAHIALALEVSQLNYAIDQQSFLVLDSLYATYTGDIPCLSVENITQYGLSANSITLDWTGYSLEYGIYFENTVTGETDTVYTDQTTYTLTGLEPGTLYLYRIQSFCQEGHRSPGPIVGGDDYFFITGDICHMPENFSVIGTTWESVTLTGHSDAEKLIHIWAKDTANYGDANYYIPGWSAAVDTFTILGIHDYLNMTYKVSIRSVCSASVGDSSAWTAPIEFTTDKPECGAPADLRSTVTETSADLSWTQGKNNDYVWLMFRKASARTYDTINVYLQHYKLSDLEQKTTYTWSLQAICGDNRFASAVVSDEFTTLGTGNELPWEKTISVRAENGRIRIYNPGAHRIDRVDVFDAGGKTLYSENLRTTDHILLPVLDKTTRLAIVRIISGQESAIYKVIVL